MSNTRIITAIIAFVATFIFSAGLVRIIFGVPETPSVFVSRTHCSNRQARAIENFIWQDERNGQSRLARVTSLNDNYNSTSDDYYSDYASAVNDYVETSSSMDSSAFPRDFQAAWDKHMNAWRNYADFISEMKSSTARANLSEREFRIKQSQLDAEITNTWHELLRIGRTYGARVY